MPRLTSNIPIPCETAATADACSTEWSEIDLGLREPQEKMRNWSCALPAKIMIRTKPNVL
jgi:hypothetical protein